MDQPNQPVEGMTPPPVPDMPPMPDFTPVTEPPKKKMSGWLIALIVVVVICCCLVVVVGGGIAIFGNVFKDVFNNFDMNDFQYLVPVSQFVM